MGAVACAFAGAAFFGVWFASVLGFAAAFPFAAGAFASEAFGAASDLGAVAVAFAGAAFFGVWFVSALGFAAAFPFTADAFASEPFGVISGLGAAALAAGFLRCGFGASCGFAAVVSGLAAAVLLPEAGLLGVFATCFLPLVVGLIWSVAAAAASLAA